MPWPTSPTGTSRANRPSGSPGQALAAFTVKDATSEGTYETTGDTSLGWGYWSLTVVPKGGGDPIPMKGRATVVVKKVGGKWQYIVDHASVPLPPPPASK